MVKYSSIFRKTNTPTGQSLVDKKNIQEVIIYFEQLYGLHVSAGDYSKNDGEWTAFTAIELQRIKEIG